MNYIRKMKQFKLDTTKAQLISTIVVFALALALGAWLVY